MPRPKGAKNKPRKMRVYESLPDVLTTSEAASWLRISRSELLKKIYAGKIPKDCYFRIGSHHKLIKNKLAIFFGIQFKSDNSPEFPKQGSDSLGKNTTLQVIEEVINSLGLHLSKFKFSIEDKER
jgi:hypothetical protein